MSSSLVQRFFEWIRELAVDLGGLPAAVILGLLPRRWREGLRFADDSVPLRYGVYFTGAIQMVVCAGLWIWLFLDINTAAHAALPRVDDPEAEPVARAVVAFGSLFDPRGWLLLYGGLEGVLRIGAAHAEIILGISPLWLLAQLDALIGQALGRRRERPRLPDRPERQGEGWQIDASHPKPWGETCTIRIEEVLYRVVEEKLMDDRDYPHRYCLEPIDSSWLVRRVEAWPEGPDLPEERGAL